MYEVDVFFAAITKRKIQELGDDSLRLLQECCNERLGADEDPNVSRIRNIMIIDPSNRYSFLFRG